jgi:hypothetical protein
MNRQSKYYSYPFAHSFHATSADQDQLLQLIFAFFIKVVSDSLNETSVDQYQPTWHILAATESTHATSVDQKQPAHPSLRIICCTVNFSVSNYLDIFSPTNYQWFGPY